VEIPHLGNMYDGSAPGLASEVKEMRAASRGHALSLHSTMAPYRIPCTRAPGNMSKYSRLKDTAHAC
jgi:hypothetical protein